MYQPDNRKPPAYDLNQKMATEDQQYNWNIEDMPWKRDNSGSSVVLFNGNNSPLPVPSTSGINLNRPPSMKRKTEECNFFPSKQLITEEKMALHLNGMHLSDSFQAHNININTSTFEEDMDMSFNVNLSPQELERRLKNAQRITMCDDIKKSLQQNDEIIPKVLLDRIEKPCKALVLWQPPQNSLGFLTTNFNQNKSFSDKKMDEDEMKNDEEDKMCE